MLTFKITYTDDREEQVQAEAHYDHAPWIDFLAHGQQVLRVRAGDVYRIERV